MRDHRRHGLADFLYAYTAAAEYIGGVPLLDAPDRQTFHRRVNEQWVPAVGTPGAFSQRGRRFESVVKHLLGEPPLWREGLGPADLLVQRAARWPGHCTFDSDVRDQAFEGLVKWIERGVKPADDDVLTTDRASPGRRWTPRPHPADLAR
jgi:hypothetical protein